MENKEIVELLKTELFNFLIKNAYIDEKKFLHEDFQDVEDDLMISHAKAYIVKIYDGLETAEAKKEFIDFLNDMAGPTMIHSLVRDYMANVNSLKYKIGDRVDQKLPETIKELEGYKDSNVYKELSKDNNKIARIIKEYHGYLTLKELKSKCHEESNDGEYIVSEEEIKIIEATKNYPIPNQLAHLIFADRKEWDYHCDHEIKNENEALKSLLVSTNKSNPKYDIVFDDGTIVCYKAGDIRVRAYNFKQVLRYTKLYCARNFDKMSLFFDDPKNSKRFDAETPENKGKQFIIQSFIRTRGLLADYECVYTKKMIEDAKTNLDKVKELTKKYDL